MYKVRIPVLAAVIGCVSLIGAMSAQAAETVTLKAEFSPEKLGAPTNAHGTGTFTNSTGKVPSPITKFELFGPAGLTLNVVGTGECTEKVILETGGKGCPKDSVAGAGGGLGVFELAGTEIQEKFTLNFYRGPDENGKTAFLLYVNAVSPVSVQLALKAQVVAGPAPYGLGLNIEVPLIPTLPEASNASVKEGFITLGATGVTYIKTVKGKKKLEHVKGLVLPKKCPKSGFPVEATFSFEDGSTVPAKTTVPCKK